MKNKTVGISKHEYDILHFSITLRNVALYEGILLIDLLEQLVEAASNR